MDKIDKLAKAIASSQTPKGKTKPYDTTAVVKRVEGGIAWVHIADGVPETPAVMAINAKEGDTVRLNVAGGSAYIIGNVDSPPTDDSYAMQAERQAIRAAKAADAASEQATKAQTSADTAERNAQRASKAADTAVEDAGTARTAAEQAQVAVVEIEGDVNSLQTRVAEAEETVSDLEDDVDGLSSRVATAEGKVAIAETNITNLQGRVSTAESDITAVEGDITTLQGRVADAEEDVDATLRELSIAQDVVGTINWITNHGTMTNQAGQTFDSNQVYFVVDANGDYLVGGTRYSVVAEPVASDIANYYLLSISESVQNYVATHIAVDSEGLWIIPDAGGNKVLIATGQGSTYTSAGTYIIGKVNNVDTVLASFLADGAQIGQDANTHAVIDYHSLQLIAKEGRIFFHVSDLRNQEGIATLTDYFYGDGTTTQFTFSINQVVAVIEVSIDDVAQEEGVDYTFTSSSITFTTAPSDEASIVVTYESTSTTAKAFTFGIRRSGSAVGAYSFVHGYQCRATGAYSHAEGSYATANGQYSHSEGSESRARGRASHAEGSGQANAYLSHAEGLNSKANGQYSHSEGYYAQANGNGSHAEGEYSIADGAYQTVIGRNNVADTTSAFIIGNGTNYDARRNAFQIGWDNGVRVGLDTSVSNVNDYALYQAITALGWQNDVLE